MLHDPWLSRWLPLLKDCAGTRPVLEIGCGTGADTATLAEAGFAVVAFDLSAASATATRARVPGAQVSCQDVRAPFPPGTGEAGAVIASLSLHYFPWAETLDLVRRVRDTLQPGGLLLCRLNSVEDKHFGATGHPAIEPDYYLVDGQPKRFFDERATAELFASGWQLLAMEHQTTRKYVRQKALWEVVARRGDSL
ncbi:class I SAM-dependent methyltransferase [Rubrivivax gelatinosus]|uniref:Methyltransferase family protein n=1 Tax=Rubrivivax gelatinosus TaxID=28068 RepID=A0A4R2MV11_RUBGE|nr:class I SAM-dependent methyltransferase [Rubrivivax gelatinosus]MBK1690203.1 SAM-dependent methyltransferase [Rubrivivax gelatinosus]TCP03473.1 methyltransferase family protein [Rubrivivax gelatinosus]